MSFGRLRPDRGVLVVVMGTVGFVLLLADSGFLGSAAGSTSRVAWLLTLPPMILGVSACAFGVAVAFLERRGMIAGRIDPRGYLRVVYGGLFAGAVLLLHWVVIGYAVVAQLWT